ncbi:PREDICTED: uncharacterized protein LOC103330726 [Prunus mume]|uniref:Uncharacterized protein LOC103330726 n=1 Tax=Prunus mume TaxID=102107 RepID=A0ABM0NY58_PRUMU|nr:PREDICTED: uncharacterized protein LOC103330726 [Prunus mume]
MTIFKSRGLWNLVEKGVKTSDSEKKKDEGSSEDDVDGKMAIVLMQDAKALESFIMQSRIKSSLESPMLNQRRWHGICRTKNITVVSRYKGKPKCYNCDRFGHLAKECTAAKTVQKANSANQLEMTGNLFYANSTVTGPRVNGEWYIDSGCSNHMIRNVELLVDVRINIADKVEMPTGDLVNVAGMGSLVIDTNKGRKYVREVMYLPGLKENLLSVGQMDEHGYFLVFGGGMCSVYDGPSLESLVMKVKKKVNRCYPLALLSENQVVLKASVTHSTETWHKRLGHLHFGGLKQLRDKEMVQGCLSLEVIIYDGPSLESLVMKVKKKVNRCYPLALLSENQVVLKASVTHSTETWHKRLGHLHFGGLKQLRDKEMVQGCLSLKTTMESAKAANLENNTEKNFQEIKHKEQLLYLNWLTKFKAMTELQSGFKIKCLRSDRGGKFKLSEFVLLFEHRHNLEPKSFKGVFVGYATCEKGYRVFDPLSTKLFLSRDIVFDEEAAWNWEENSESISPNAGSFIHGDISTGSSDRMVLSPTSSTLSPPRRVLSIEDFEVQSKSPISSESASMSNLSERHN